MPEHSQNPGRVQILLCGSGLIGEKHARLVLDHSQAELAAVAALDTAENRQKVKDWDVPFFSDFAAALNAGDCDGVIISTPNELHFDQAMTCVEAGVPALVEKPITETLEQAEQLVIAAEQRNVPILTGHHRTYSPLLTAAKRTLDSEAFGNLVAVNGSALFYKPDSYFEAGPWRTQKGGGPILINLIHEIGIMRFLAGEITRVSALASSKQRGFEVEDSVALSLRFANGAVGTFILSDAAASTKSWEQTSGENPAYAAYPNSNCYHLAGTRGALDFPSMQFVHVPKDREPSWWLPAETTSIDVEHADPLALQLEHFIDVIRGRAAPLVSAREGYRNMVVLDAVLRSIECGNVIELEYA